MLPQCVCVHPDPNGKYSTLPTWQVDRMVASVGSSGTAWILAAEQLTVMSRPPQGLDTQQAIEWLSSAGDEGLKQFRNLHGRIVLRHGPVTRLDTSGAGVAILVKHLQHTISYATKAIQITSGLNSRIGSAR
eukprot:scpid57058/ scgid13830/ 